MIRRLRAACLELRPAPGLRLLESQIPGLRLFRSLRVFGDSLGFRV